MKTRSMMRKPWFSHVEFTASPAPVRRSPLSSPESQSDAPPDPFER